MKGFDAEYEEMCLLFINHGYKPPARLQVFFDISDAEYSSYSMIIISVLGLISIAVFLHHIGVLQA